MSRRIRRQTPVGTKGIIVSRQIAKEEREGRERERGEREREREGRREGEGGETRHASRHEEGDAET